jgi:hypothetical protein
MKRFQNAALGFLSGLVAALALGVRTVPAPIPVPAAEEPPAPARPMAALHARPAIQLQSDWSRLESTNYVDYVRNLRGIHAPEAVIYDIIRADLIATCIPRTEPTQASTLRETLGGDRSLDENRRRFMAFSSQLQHVDDILEKQLGLRRFEPDAYFLTSEHFRLIKEARQKFPRLNYSTTDPASMEAAEQNLRARAAFLAPRMNAEQMLAYKVVYEGFGDRIADALGLFRPTQEEFVAMVNNMPHFSGQGFIPLLPSILSPARLAAYQSMQEPHLRRLHQGMQSASLSPEDQASTLELVAERGRLSPAEFRRKLRELLPRPDQFSQVLMAIGL